MKSGRFSFRGTYERLLAEFGSKEWWPADSGFERMVGAVLTQNTAWRNVESSIDCLRRAGRLAPDMLIACDEQTLRSLIRPSGYMTAKAATLHRLAAWRLEHCDDDVAAWPDAVLRESLLAMKGIGFETADAIALYVFDRNCFVWDAYSRRLIGHLSGETPASYEKARIQYEAAFRADEFATTETQEFHALVIDAGKKVRAQGWDWFVRST